MAHSRTQPLSRNYCLRFYDDIPCSRNVFCLRKKLRKGDKFLRGLNAMRAGLYLRNDTTDTTNEMQVESLEVIHRYRSLLEYLVISDGRCMRNGTLSPALIVSPHDQRQEVLVAAVLDVPAVL